MKLIHRAQKLQAVSDRLMRSIEFDRNIATSRDSIVYANRTWQVCRTGLSRPGKLDGRFVVYQYT
jgi:hypothetical protein